MVLALARPEIDDLFPDLWADRNAQQIRLNALSRKAGERLVHKLLDAAASPELAARLLAQAGGNVFYLEELIRAVAQANDQGAAAAEREGQRAAAILEAAPPLRAPALAVLARARLAQGEVDEARELARELAAR